MANCYVFCGTGLDGKIYCTGVCATNPKWDVSQQYGASNSFAPYDGNTCLRNPWATTAGSITLCTNESELASAMSAGIAYINDCNACLSNPPPQQKYDCINGVCTPKSTYSTPGIYASLTDCQAVCANGGACAEGKQCLDPNTYCPPGKVCIDQGEFSEAEALISKIGSEVC